MGFRIIVAQRKGGFYNGVEYSYTKKIPYKGLEIQLVRKKESLQETRIYYTGKKEVLIKSKNIVIKLF